MGIKIKKTIYPHEPQTSYGEWMDSIIEERKNSQMKDMESMSVKNIVKAISAQKNMSIKDVADKCHKSSENLHQQLNRGSINLKQFQKILGAMGEDLVIVTSNGNRYKLDDL